MFSFDFYDFKSPYGKDVVEETQIFRSLQSHGRLIMHNKMWSVWVEV
jgi:hypothetical protein